MHSETLRGATRKGATLQGTTPGPRPGTDWRAGLASWAGAVLDVLHPPTCAACGELLEPIDPDGAMGADPSGSIDPATDASRPLFLPLCTPCSDTFEPVSDPCLRCGEPDSDAGLCGHCIVDEPPFESVVSLWHYGAAIADVLQHFKYSDRPELAKPLGRALACAQLPEVDVIAPVPLHFRRRLSRGYDQALLLARELAKAAGLPFERSLLIRSRATSRQVGSSRVVRANNVAGAFEAGPALGRWAGARVLLVDDVITTGSTAAACAQVLLKGGVDSVHVACVARAG